MQMNNLEALRTEMSEIESAIVNNTGQLKLLTDKAEIKLMKSTIAELKKALTTKKKELKAAEKFEQEKASKELLAIKDFFTYLSTRCKFDAIARETDQTNGYLLYIDSESKVNVLFINDESPITVTVSFHYPNYDNAFYTWLCEDKKAIKFTSEDMKIFKKMSMKATKTGVSAVLDSVTYSKDENGADICNISGDFYTNGNLAVGFEKDIIAITEVENANVYDKESAWIKTLHLSNIDFTNNLCVKDEGKVILELAPEMIFVQQANANYYLAYSKISEETGVTLIDLYSVSTDGLFTTIHQNMKAVVY